MSDSRRVSALAAAIALLALPVRAQGHTPIPVSPAPQPIFPMKTRGRLPVPASVMWIAAHPDDEALTAPLLARWCGDGHARCVFLTATRGGAGACVRSDGCLPDLATVRSGEAGASSQYFGADAILLSLPDGGSIVPPPWDIDAGGSREIVGTIAGFIRAEAPELVLTFDPRHGTTCHPDHRAVAAIVLEAVKTLTAPPAVYLLETRLEVDPQPLALHFRSAAPNAIRFDANHRLAATGGPAWNAVTADMERNPSQFDAAWLAAVSLVPLAERAVYIAPASTILQQPVWTCP
jgi:LmbE family N-acetylglucosaminyl deacetylase